MIVDKTTSQLQDFVQILNPPSALSGDRTFISVEYRCTAQRYVGVEVISNLYNIYTQYSVKVFQYVWRCHSNIDNKSTRLRKVRLKLPEDVAFNYNAFNRNVTLTSVTSIRAWVLDKKWLEHCWHLKNCYSRSLVKVKYDTAIQDPFSRPFKGWRTLGECKSWGWEVLYYATSVRIPVCQVEQGLYCFRSK